MVYVYILFFHDNLYILLTLLICGAQNIVWCGVATMAWSQCFSFTTLLYVWFLRLFFFPEHAVHLNIFCFRDMLSMMSALNRKPPLNLEITVAFSEDEKRQRKKGKGDTIAGQNTVSMVCDCEEYTFIVSCFYYSSMCRWCVMATYIHASHLEYTRVIFV